MMHYLQAFVFAFLATVAFGVLFQGPKRILWRSGLIGGLGWVVFIGLKEVFSVHSFSANFLATVTIALASEIFARIWREPTTVFEVPAIIPLVPGLGMYKGMNYILQDYVSYGSEVLLGAALDACAIALGIMMVSGVFRALKTGSDMARQRQQDLLGTAVSPDLYVTDPEEVAPFLALEFNSIEKKGFIAFNLFIDLFLCTLVMFFLNVRPKRFFTGKKRYFVRAMAILPVAYEACSIYLKGQAATGKILLPFWTFPLLTVKPPMTFMVFVVLVLYIKQREWRFRRHGKMHAEYRAFLKTNRNSLQFSIFLAVVLVVAAILDFVIMVFLTASAAVEAGSAEVFAGNQAEVVRMMTGAFAMGFGDAVSLLLVAPLVLLFSYTRIPKNKVFSAVIPVAAIVLMIIFLFEGAYQGFSYLAKEVPHMSMREIVDLITIEIPGLAQVVH